MKLNKVISTIRPNSCEAQRYRASIKSADFTAEKMLNEQKNTLKWMSGSFAFPVNEYRY